MTGVATIDCLTDHLIAQNRMEFNGRIDIQNASGTQWSFYYRQGRIVWATGGLHPVKRWRRMLAQFSPHINPNSIRLREEKKLPNAWDYHILTVLTKREQITREQAVSIIKNNTLEILFDLNQQSKQEEFNYSHKQQTGLDTPLTLLNINDILEQSKQKWQAWLKAGLADISPNLSPKIIQFESLQQEVSANVYDKLVTLLDGSRTLRDLAVQMKQDLLQLTRSLTPYIRKGLVDLVEITDQLPIVSTVNQVAAVTTEEDVAEEKNEVAPISDLQEQKSEVLIFPAVSNLSSPLIACVDDSHQTCQMMKYILIKAGYRFMAIQDSLQVLPTLIERKPDFIFLDLMMPIANGYEICAQLRRVTQFKDTPIAILTSNDGVVDRVRAKMVGASSFLAKPVESKKVLAVVQKYLEPNQATAKSEQQIFPVQNLTLNQVTT